jgi:hypothetical protein
MQIAIYGAFLDGDGFSVRGTRESFAAACREIAKVWWEQGHVISIETTLQTDADYHFGRAFLDLAGEAQLAKPRIILRRPLHASSDWNEFIPMNSSLFSYAPRSQPYWEAGTIDAIGRSDAVFLIGGRNGSLMAGMGAHIARKKLYCVGSFGGAAERMLDVMEKEAKQSEQTTLAQLRLPWSPVVLQQLARLTGRRRVVIVHGRATDYEVLKGLLVEQLGSDVRLMIEEFGESKALPEKWEDVAESVDAAIVIATPDDEGRAAEDTQPLKPRARQNVWLEAGWFWGSLGRSRMLILTRGAVEFPSDLSGIEYYEYKSSPAECRSKIEAFVRSL